MLVGTFFVIALGLATGEPLFGSPADPEQTTGYGLVDAWGRGFWELIEFTLQMAMIIIGGYAVAVSPPVGRLIARLARIPSTPQQAIAFTAAIAMITAYLNCAFSSCSPPAARQGRADPQPRAEARPSTVRMLTAR